MSYYVELLRAKRALIVAAIILGIILATAIIVRLSLHGTSVSNWPVEMGSSATAHVAKTTLADGSVRSVVDDPARGLHAVFVQHPDKSYTFDVRERNESGHSERDDISMGSMNMNDDVYANGTMRHTYGTFKPADVRIDFGWLFIVTIPIALIVATIVAGVLAKENDGHLEMAWTKPYSRETYALAAFGVDIAAIVASELMTIVVLVLCALLFSATPSLRTSGDTLWFVGMAIFGPVAWYALLTGASASLKRGPGLILGLGWVVAVIVPSLAKALEGVSHISAVGAAFYGIFRTIAYIDPITYLSFSFNEHSYTRSLLGLSFEANVGILALLALVYLTLSVLQWRRVEA